MSKAELADRSYKNMANFQGPRSSAGPSRAVHCGPRKALIVNHLVPRRQLAVCPYGRIRVTGQQPANNVPKNIKTEM